MVTTHPTRTDWASVAQTMAMARLEARHLATHGPATASRDAISNAQAIHGFVTDAGLDPDDPSVQLAMWVALRAVLAAIQGTTTTNYRLLMTSPVMTVGMTLLEWQPIEAAEAELNRRPPHGGDPDGS